MGGVGGRPIVIRLELDLEDDSLTDRASDGAGAATDGPRRPTRGGQPLSLRLPRSADPPAPAATVPRFSRPRSRAPITTRGSPHCSTARNGKAESECEREPPSSWPWRPRPC